jgi:hypothetical protein
MKLASALMMMTALSAHAGTASSSAGAGSSWWGPGTAVATADYDGGGKGFARTDAKSGRVSTARGVAFGVDEDGMSLSSSYAVAPKLGPALAGTFNLAIGLDGRVAASVGRTVATGGGSREAQAGGFASTGSRYQSPASGASVSGRTGLGGRVVSNSESYTRSPHRVTKIGKRVRRVRRLARLR